MENPWNLDFQNLNFINPNNLAFKICLTCYRLTARVLSHSKSVLYGFYRRNVHRCGQQHECSALFTSFTQPHKTFYIITWFFKTNYTLQGVRGTFSLFRINDVRVIVISTVAAPKLRGEKHVDIQLQKRSIINGHMFSDRHLRLRESKWLLYLLYYPLKNNLILLQYFAHPILDFLI